MYAQCYQLKFRLFFLNKYKTIHLVINKLSSRDALKSGLPLKLGFRIEKGFNVVMHRTIRKRRGLSFPTL